MHGANSDGGSPFSPDELIRLMMETLERLGMSQTVQALKDESHLLTETPSMAELRAAVLEGHWDKAIEELHRMAGSVTFHEPRSLKFTDWDKARRGRSNQELGLAYLCVRVYEEQFLEALEEQKAHSAMKILRESIKSQYPPPSFTEHLTRLLLCSSAEDVRHTANWPGVSGGARQALMHEMELCFSPDDVLPSHRLDVLLRQALSYQRAQYPYQGVNGESLKHSLLTDYLPSGNSFPNQCTIILQGHTDEVWVATFSHNNDILASGGKDGRVILWDVKNQMQAITCLQHTEPVSNVAWSSDDKRLLVSSEEVVVEWDLADKGARVLAEHESSITAVQWLPGSLPSSQDQEAMYVTGALDHKVHFWRWGGAKEKTLDFAPFCILGLDVSPNGRYMVILGWKSPPDLAQLRMMEETMNESGEDHVTALQRFSELMRRHVSGKPLNQLSRELRILYPLFSKSSEYEDLEEPCEPTVPKEYLIDDCFPCFARVHVRKKPMRVWVWDNYAQAVAQSYDFSHKFNHVSFSKDGQHVLLSQAHGPVHMMDIHSGSIVQKYYGRKAASAVLRSSFAFQGDDLIQDIGTYVISGSDNGHLCIWHRATGQHLQTSCKHPEGRVNDLSWCHGPSRMLVSCGDDATVRIWEPGKRKGFQPAEKKLSEDVPIHQAPEPQGSFAQLAFQVHAIPSSKQEPEERQEQEPSDPIPVPRLSAYIDNPMLLRASIAEGSFRAFREQARSQDDTLGVPEQRT